MIKKCMIVLLSMWFGAAAASTHETVLGNGLKVLVREDHRAPVVVSQVWYKVGSSYEYNGITGISHVLEHMMFKGTRNFPEDTFSKLINENGGNLNAFTSYDFTGYYETLRKELLPLSFELEADRMQNLVFNRDEFKKEKNVVINERLLRTDDVPENLAYERFRAAAFPGSPYHHPIIGWMRDINSISLEEAEQWYLTWYAPNNATLVVVGDVDHQAVFEMAEKYFGKIPRRAIKPIKSLGSTEGVGKRQLDVNLPVQVGKLFIGYNTPSLNTIAEEWEPYALEVIAHILDGGSSSRLQKHLVRQQQLCSSIGIQYDPFTLHASLFEIHATPSDTAKMNQLKMAIFDQLNSLKETLVSREELQRVKTNTVANKIYEQDSMFYQAMEMGILETTGVTWQEADQYVNKIAKVTPEQIQAVAKKYFVADHVTITRLLPEEQLEG